MEDVTGAEVVVVEPTMAEIAANGNVQPEVAANPEKTETTKEVPPASEEGVIPVVEAPAQEAVDKRIGVITAEKYGFKREAERLKAELDELKVKQSKPVLPADSPQLEDYDYDEGRHQEALIQHQVNKALDTQYQIATQQQTEQAKQKIANDFTSKEAEYIAKHPEYAEEIMSLPVFDEGALNAIYELGPQVSHYLAKHPDIASEVANASPTMAAVRLGQISTGLSAESKPVKPSTAPDPVKVIAGGGAVAKSQDEMSMSEIMAMP